MNLVDDPWELPAPRRFLFDIESEIARGALVVIGDASLPGGFDSALRTYFRNRGFVVEALTPDSRHLPAEAVATAFASTPDLRRLARDSSLTDHLASISTECLDEAAITGWRLFLARFLREKEGPGDGLRVLLKVNSEGEDWSTLPHVMWRGRLRRTDVSVWADLHAPLSRQEPLATLAAALAIDLCGWRLDLAADIARARREDLLNPIGWLELHISRAVAATCMLNDEPMECPLALLKQGREEEIRRRIWKAQLTALFPWLESHRQRVLEKHHRLLRVDGQLRDLGLRDVNDLELGRIARQLRSRIGRAESDLLECLAALRNDLAHRRVVDSETLNRALHEAPPL